MESQIQHHGHTVFRHGRRWRFKWERRWISRDSVSSAVSELDRLLNERERTRLSSRVEGLTVANLLGEWWPRKTRELRESSQMRYESVMRLHVVPVLGPLSANGLRPMDLEDYYSGVTYKTALVSRDVLRPAFKWGMANGLVIRVDGCNPLELAALSRSRCLGGDAEADANMTMRVDERLIPTVGEIEKLLADAEERGDGRWWLYLRLAPTIGGRPGEMCALRRADIDEANGTIHISRSANKHTFTVTSVKRSSSVRTLEVGGELFDDIRPLLADMSSDEFLFPATGFRNGNRRIDCWTAGSVRGRLARAAERLDIPRYTPHAFRHFCATHLLDQGWQPMQVALWLGHKNDTMVRLLYAAHIVEDTRRQLGAAAARLVRRQAVDPRHAPR